MLKKKSFVIALSLTSLCVAVGCGSSDYHGYIKMRNQACTSSLGEYDPVKDVCLCPTAVGGISCNNGWVCDNKSSKCRACIDGERKCENGKYSECWDDMWIDIPASSPFYVSCDKSCDEYGVGANVMENGKSCVPDSPFTEKTDVEELNVCTKNEECKVDADGKYKIFKCKNGISQPTETVCDKCDGDICIKNVKDGDECRENESRCVNDVDHEVCQKDGDKLIWKHQEPCKLGCAGDICACDDNVAPICDGNNVVKCENGSWNKVNCGDYGCIDGACKCNDGDVRCNDGDVQECKNGNWIKKESCLNGCSNGACREVCEEGSVKCDKDKYMICSGGNWNNSDQCGENGCFYDENNQLMCKCTDNNLKCENGNLMKCIDGKWHERGNKGGEWVDTKTNLVELEENCICNQDGMEVSSLTDNNNDGFKLICKPCYNGNNGGVNIGNESATAGPECFGRQGRVSCNPDYSACGECLNDSTMCDETGAPVLKTCVDGKWNEGEDCLAGCKIDDGNAVCAGGGDSEKCIENKERCIYRCEDETCTKIGVIHQKCDKKGDWIDSNVSVPPNLLCDNSIVSNGESKCVSQINLNEQIVSGVIGYSYNINGLSFEDCGDLQCLVLDNNAVCGCAEEDKRCDGNKLQKCNNGMWVDDKTCNVNEICINSNIKSGNKEAACYSLNNLRCIYRRKGIVNGTGQFEFQAVIQTTNAASYSASSDLYIYDDCTICNLTDSGVLTKEWDGNRMCASGTYEENNNRNNMNGVFEECKNEKIIYKACQDGQTCSASSNSCSDAVIDPQPDPERV
ncbi:MAG: hypothetical protein IJ165_10445 [Proteobacteria bacterium]|nr:hypothetical protein [Pseudomonadota bacterium]